MSKHYQNARGRGGNPWNKPSSQPVGRSAEHKFHDAQVKQQASIQKHLQNDIDSSSDEENLESANILNSVLQNYSQVGGASEHLGRTQQFLEDSFQSGAGICLICIATIKRIDPIWSCIECFGYFHLTCIQKWARDNIFQQKQALEDLPDFHKPKSIHWACPKCRHDYEQSEIPVKYVCFCEKVSDPEHHPWLVPHSCGETCGKPLQPGCGHLCLLLCHPGPCPPCPKTVKTSCHCLKQAAKPRRCSDKLWSCGAVCGKHLLCNKHTCETTCHEGDCPPCPRQSVQRCMCGVEQAKRPCANPSWQCDKICDIPLDCGHHSCTVTCHHHESSKCPASLERTCPCGKATSSLPCTQEPPTCNDTCGKTLECGAHTCEQKCHRDACGMCREIVNKVCRCGLHRKEISCQKEFLCDTKCKRTKTCLRHPCNRKCCDTSCPPCEKACGRTLGCGIHKCSSVCHRGPCYPCPQTGAVKCRCTHTKLTVPCGRQKRTKPPRCNRLCLIPPECDHSAREPHRCHFGDCPACRLACLKSRPNCSHLCPVQCHAAVRMTVEQDYKPAGPWEVQAPQLVRRRLDCPPCDALVPVTCLGGHETQDWPCHTARPSSCHRSCGQQLPCGNHTCTRPCHVVATPLSHGHEPQQCLPCEAGCQAGRPEGCTHRCRLPCHPGPCHPCEFNVKTKCHCGVSTLYVKCGVLHPAQDSLLVLPPDLSCGIDCPLTYACGHPCRSKCHPGPCPDEEQCRRKVKMSCPCGRLKKDFTCNVIRTATPRVDCDDACVVKKMDVLKAKEMEEIKRKEEEERRNKEEVERFEKKFHGKKKHRERHRSVAEHDAPWFKSRWFMILSCVGAATAVGYMCILYA